MTHVEVKGGVVLTGDATYAKNSIVLDNGHGPIVIPLTWVTDIRKAGT